jgi:putative Mg2+ transporter-C (MgtC) family protein
VDTFLSNTEILVRMAIAVVAGGLLGLEREWRRKPAGLRTHIMVALGAAVFTVVSLELYERIVLDSPEVARVDPLRLIEGVIGGIGFLGAGSILQARGSIHGLTTAGNLWLCGAVGVACGGGHYLIAAYTVALGLFVLIVLGWTERRWMGKEHEE